MNLKQVGGDINFLEYGGTFATKKLNNGDFDYWFFVEFVNMPEAVGEDEVETTYMISIRAVSPSEPSKQTKIDALYSLGLEEEYSSKIDTIKPFEMAKMLNEYGVGAVLFSKSGNNAKKLFKKARTECEKIESLFGFYMDNRLNMIGNTGGGFIKGEIGFKREEK